MPYIYYRVLLHRYTIIWSFWLGMFLIHPLLIWYVCYLYFSNLKRNACSYYYRQKGKNLFPPNPFFQFPPRHSSPRSSMHFPAIAMCHWYVIGNIEGDKAYVTATADANNDGLQPKWRRIRYIINKIIIGSCDQIRCVAACAERRDPWILLCLPDVNSASQHPPYRRAL